jgi:hypothetical protein
MTPTIIIAQAGSGKTINAALLMQTLGCTRLVEEWDGKSVLRNGDLALTNADFCSKHQAGRVLTLAEAQAQCSAA